MGLTDERNALQPGRGRDARAPGEIPVAGWKDILWRLYRAISEDRILLTAAGVTFYIMLALVPTLAAFVSIYGLFNDRASVIQHVELLAGIVPPGALDIIREQLNRLTSESNNTLGLTLIFSLAVALWSSSAGVKAMFEAMNVAYHEREERSFFVIAATALLFTLGGAFASLLVVAAVVVMPTVVALLPISPGVEWTVRLGAYAAMLLVLSFGIAALYRWGPSRETAQWRWITPGAILAIVLLGATSVLFSWYVANFTDNNATYGSLGAAIGLMTWLWISVTLVIVGAELNSEIEHQTARDSTTGPELPLGARGAHMADSVGRVWPPAREEVEVVAAAPSAAQPRAQLGSVLDTLAVALPAAAAVLMLATRRRRS
ncbi:YihY/virulence factor BrkB family protein [Methylobrevis albus]|uniref:YihY/virulence factor BrkB family protein n=1 Tax=Methylobrevis albus TaxID=2793297 RepID=A0A931I215_9HYPH|nr:YihY/virulence factor BrkB family protein [Methylobrevis albus]MBH0238377.1 YihY/virulence factor BrkB family protein [Methylobrevis albus]